MFSDWALWELDDYRDMLVEVAVRSGLYDALQEGSVGNLSEHFDASLTPRVLDALLRVGVVRETPDRGYRWTGPEPDIRTLYRWDAARRWLGLAQRIRKTDLPVPKTIASPLLAETAPLLSEWMLRVIRPQIGTSWLDVGGGQGAWARQLSLAGVSVVLAEQPGVVRKSEVPRGVSLWEGDIFERVPECGPFDGISLVRFIEDWDPFQIEGLLGRLAALLTETGTLYVVGYFRDRAHWGALFDVNAMVSSAHGISYAVATLQHAAEKSGLHQTMEAEADFDTYTLVGFQKRSSPISG